MAQDTARTIQRTERAHRSTAVRWPSTPHTQDSASGGLTGEQEPSGPGYRARNTTHRSGTPVNRSQVAQDAAHTTQHNKRAHR